ncbi:MAG TPA: hypothetical protein VNM67_21420 [Thermoanaerobaculia bacterium]|jgi:hypothetical protein|nr:hypothetical protein [Thermoanaerobaculia bacterium]
MMSSALFRQFTTGQLKDYSGAAATFLDAVLAALGKLHGVLSFRANPFEEVEREVTLTEAGAILTEAEKLGVDSFELFWRGSMAADPFPFLFRIYGSNVNDAYKYSERVYSGMPYPPPSSHGYQLDCAISVDLLRRSGAAAEGAVRNAFQDLFIRSGAVYGYATTACLLTVLSGYSELERERNAPDRAYKGLWCDGLRKVTSGVFAVNWLGRELSLRLPERARHGAGWIVQDLREGGVSLVAEEGLAVGEGPLQDLAARMADLLPAEEARVALPEVFRQSLVLQPGEVARLGGVAFIRQALTPWRVTELKSGRVILSTEYHFRSDHLVAGQCLWPLRPAKLELWEIDVPPERLVRVSRLVPIKEPVRAQIRLRISEEELASEQGIPVCLAVIGSGAAKGKASALQALRDVASKVGGLVEVTAETPKITKGRIWLANADLDVSIELAESVRDAVGPRASVLLALGELSEVELDMRLQMTGPNWLYMKL